MTSSSECLLEMRVRRSASFEAGGQGTRGVKDDTSAPWTGAVMEGPRLRHPRTLTVPMEYTPRGAQVQGEKHWHVCLAAGAGQGTMPGEERWRAMVLCCPPRKAVPGRRARQLPALYHLLALSATCL